MKFFRLTSLWGAAFFVCVSVIGPLSFSAIRSDSAFEPVYRFFRGDSSSAEETLERIFTDQFRGSSHAVLGADFERKLARHFYQLCLDNRLDPAFVLSVIQAESRFQMDAVSPAGAVGLMQLMPETARVVAKRNGFEGRITPESLRDPFLNLTLGVTYLRELRERYTGLSAYYPLAAYNLGPAKFDSLRSQPGFKPSRTLKYYQEIMKGIATWRFYSHPVEEASVQSREPRVKTEPRSA